MDGRAKITSELLLPIWIWEQFHVDGREIPYPKGDLPQLSSGLNLLPDATTRDESEFDE